MRKQLIVMVEPLMAVESPANLFQIALAVREDIQNEVDSFDHDEFEDAQEVVDDEWSDLKTSKDRGGSYLSTDIIEVVERYFCFVGEWVTPQQYNVIMDIIAKQYKGGE